MQLHAPRSKWQQQHKIESPTDCYYSGAEISANLYGNPFAPLTPKFTESIQFAARFKQDSSTVFRHSGIAACAALLRRSAVEVKVGAV